MTTEEQRRTGDVAADGDDASRALELALLRRTPARILVGAAGTSYRTATQLELRRDHAAARDAVRSELDLYGDLGAEFVRRWNPLAATSRCRDKDEYLLRPDLGRKLADESRARIQVACAVEPDLQIVIGDGLSAAAVSAQVPGLLTLLVEAATARGWSLGQLIFVRYCRVGILNDVGDLLDPSVAVLLIGERPGLRTAESLSAYLAFRPRTGHTDAERNLVCNIHEHGVPPEVAARRVIALAERMRLLGASGVAVKEELAPPVASLPR